MYEEEKVSCTMKLRVTADYYGLIATIVAPTDLHEHRAATFPKLCKGTRIRITADFAKFRGNGNATNSYSD